MTKILGFAKYLVNDMGQIEDMEVDGGHDANEDLAVVPQFQEQSTPSNNGNNAPTPNNTPNTSAVGLGASKVDENKGQVPPGPSPQPILADDNGYLSFFHGNVDTSNNFSDVEPEDEFPMSDSIPLSDEPMTENLGATSSGSGNSSKRSPRLEQEGNENRKRSRMAEDTDKYQDQDPPPGYS